MEDPWSISEEQHNSYDDTERNANELSDFQSWASSIKSFSIPISPLTVHEIPEKEGLLFKHTNYLIKSSESDKNVVRRYSDFFWLYQTLLKKYPYRLIPDLPPKGINSDITRRKKGLTRFLNNVISHPVLSQDELFHMFITVPTDLSNWRKNANYDRTEEFLNKTVTRQFIEIWENNDFIRDWFDKIVGANFIEKVLLNWTNLTKLIERFNKRFESIIKDDELFWSNLSQFNENAINDIYLIRDAHLIDISNGLHSIQTHFKTSIDIKKEKYKTLDQETLQEFKTFGDYLTSFKLLLERYNKRDTLLLPSLVSQLESAQTKLRGLNNNPDVKGFEIDKLRTSINRLEDEIKLQTNRDWLIKESILLEFILFQDTQFQLTSIFKSWIKANLKYNDLNSNNFGDLLTSLNEMPLFRNLSI